MPKSGWYVVECSHDKSRCIGIHHAEREDVGVRVLKLLEPNPSGYGNRLELRQPADDNWVVWDQEIRYWRQANWPHGNKIGDIEPNGYRAASQKAMEFERAILDEETRLAAAESDQQLSRPWSDDEKRLPLWIRRNRLPRYVAEPVEQVFLEGKIPAPLANLWAAAQLARAAECGILTVREEHAANPNAIAPAVFVQNVLYLLRSVRDEVLKETAPANVAVFSQRFDRMVDATKVTLEAFCSEPLPKIKQGRKLLQGRWIDAMKRSTEAGEDCWRLAAFIGRDSDAKPRGPYSVEWISKATDGGLNASRLAKARKSGNLVRCEKRKGAWYHDLDELAEKHAEYAIMLREFAQGDSILKRSSKKKKAAQVGRTRE